MIEKYFPTKLENYWLQAVPNRFRLASLILLIAIGVDIPGMQQDNWLQIVSIRGAMVLVTFLASFIDSRLLTRNVTEVMVFSCALFVTFCMALLGKIQNNYMTVYVAGIYETIVFLVIFLPLRMKTFISLIVAVGCLWFFLLPVYFKISIDHKIYISHFAGYISYSFMILIGNNLVIKLKEIEQKNMTSLEIEMNKLDRISLMGEIAAGISHEIRNPMTTVRGFLQLLKEKYVDTKEKEYYDLMISELDRANSIITEFLSISKSTDQKTEIQNLNKLIESILPLLEGHALKSNVEISYFLGNIKEKLINVNEIRQLILNLVINGIEAMPNGGRLSIHTYKQDDGVLLVINDEGEGIQQDILEKIGTPFVTTKDSGTGLGLAVCYGIAARNNATISVKTSSKGTAFIVRFN